MSKCFHWVLHLSTVSMQWILLFCKQTVDFGSKNVDWRDYCSFSMYRYNRCCLLRSGASPGFWISFVSFLLVSVHFLFYLSVFSFSSSADTRVDNILVHVSHSDIMVNQMFGANSSKSH